MYSLEQATHRIYHHFPIARRSKQIALARERDYLELKIRQRTQELEEAQLMRLLELQRFAEFGRISARLLHEVANPLTAASLNLNRLDHRQSVALSQARQSLRQLERYVLAARKQLSNQSEPVIFSPQAEIRQLLTVLRPLARAERVQLELESSQSIKTLGDPVKFSQIVSNLVANAIDAYAQTSLPNRRVRIRLRTTAKWIELIVQDWGKGIEPNDLPQLFEPFYTTKLSDQRGLGIGLAIVKQAVETDFQGRIAVSSTKNNGTVFKVKLPSGL